MAKGDKLAGAMSKGPSKSAMTRVSPGVYRSAEGKLVGSKGQALPQQNNMAMDMQRALQQIQPQQQGQPIPMPRGGQPMTADYRADRDGPIGTLPFAMPQMTPEQKQWLAGAQGFGPGSLPPYMMQQNQMSKVQTPNGQAYRYGNSSGIPWQDVEGGIAQGSLRNMAQGMRMKQQMPQPMPMPMPGRGSKQ